MRGGGDGYARGMSEHAEDQGLDAAREELERDEDGPEPWAKASSGDKDEVVDDEGTGPDGPGEAD